MKQPDALPRGNFGTHVCHAPRPLLFRRPHLQFVRRVIHQLRVIAVRLCHISLVRQHERGKHDKVLTEYRFAGTDSDGDGAIS